MAGGGLSLDINANPRGATSAIKDLGESLGDVVEKLDDVGARGDLAGEKLDDALRDAERQAKRTQDAVDDVGGKGFQRAREASGEFKNESLQNFSEVTSSFDGSMSSIGDLAQGTLGGLASSLPGIGLVAGAAAAGVGLITQAFSDADAKREELQQRSNDLANAYISAGTDVLNALAVASASSAALTDPDKRKEVQAYADAFGVDLSTAVRAYVGDANALAVIQGIVSDKMDQNKDIAKQVGDQTGYVAGQTSGLTAEQQKQIESNQDAIGKWNELSGVVDNAKQTFEAQQGVLIGLINDAHGATKEVDALGNQLYTLPDGEQILIDADTGKATTDVKNFKGDLDGVKEPVTVPIKVTVDSSAWDNYIPRQKNGSVAANPRVGYSWDG